MMKLFMLNTSIIMLMLGLSFLLKNKTMKTREKASPFECGFDPQHKMRSAFSLRFFLITILFLIFDVEILVMFPIPCTQIAEKNFLIFNLCIFWLLSLGLSFEWTQGALNWK